MDSGPRSLRSILCCRWQTTVVLLRRRDDVRNHRLARSRPLCGATHDSWTLTSFRSFRICDRKALSGNRRHCRSSANFQSSQWPNPTEIGAYGVPFDPLICIDCKTTPTSPMSIHSTLDRVLTWWSSESTNYRRARCNKVRNNRSR